MAGHLRQLVEASHLQELAEPWVAGARAHRIWPARGHCQSFQALFEEEEIAEPKIARKKAREEMSWPARRNA